MLKHQTHFPPHLQRYVHLRPVLLNLLDNKGVALQSDLTGCLQILSAPGNVVHNDVDPAILPLGPACKRVGFGNGPDKKYFSIRC